MGTIAILDLSLKHHMDPHPRIGYGKRDWVKKANSDIFNSTTSTTIKSFTLSPSPPLIKNQHIHPHNHSTTKLFFIAYFHSCPNIPSSFNPDQPLIVIVLKAQPPLLNTQNTVVSFSCYCLKIWYTFKSVLVISDRPWKTYAMFHFDLSVNL